MAKNLTYEELEKRVKELAGKAAKLKTMEAALRRITDERNILLGSVPTMIFWVGKEGNFIRVNNAFADALQKSPDGIKGRSLFDLYPEDMAKKYHDDNLEVISSGTPKRHIEEPVQTPAGTMWVSTDKIPFRDEKGDILGIIGFSEDITACKRAEEALREAHDDLEEKVQERTFQVRKVKDQLEREIGECRQAQQALSLTNVQFQMLQQVTAAVHSTLDVEKVLKQITDEAVYSLGYTTACIMVLSAEKTHFEVKALSTKKWLLPKIDKILGFSLRTFSFAADSKANALVNSVREGRAVVAKTLAEVAYPFVTKKTCSRLQKLGGTKNYIVVPFKAQEEVVGGLIVTSTREEVSQRELGTIGLFAEAASQAIRNASQHRRTKQAEEALRESEARYRLLFENAGSAITYFDAEGRCVLVNKRGIDYYGGKDIVGKSIYDLHPEMADAHMKRFTKIMKEAEGRTFEDTFELPGGRRWFSSNIQPVKDENGNTMGVQVISHDMTEHKRAEEALQRAHKELDRRVRERTAELAKANKELQKEIAERKQTEAALRESENKYRELANLLPQTVFEIDQRGNFTFANRYGLESAGYTQEDIDRGLNALELFIPKDRGRVAQNIRKILRGEKTQGHEYTALRKDGSTFPVLVYSSPIIRDNKPVGLRGIVIDVTERKRAERELRESEHKYRRLFDDANDAIFIADTETHIILDANRQAEKLIGRPRDEFVGMDHSKLHPPDHAEYYVEKFRKHVRTGQVFDFQAEVITKDGNIVPVFISASVVHIHGQPVMQGLLRDATEERRILDLKEEIKTRTLIEKAKRILMDRYGITDKEVTRRLQKESRRQRKKVVEIAQAIVSSELILN